MEMQILAKCLLAVQNIFVLSGKVARIKHIKLALCF